MSPRKPGSGTENCRLGSDHTMCQYQRAKCNKIGKGLNDDEGQAILLDKHNELRGRIVIPAYLTLFDMGGGLTQCVSIRAES